MDQLTNCTTRNELLRQWSDATQRFSDSIGYMRANVGDMNGQFNKHMRLAEAARLKAENARLMLEIHRSEHGC